jgi:hypothetical protein
LSDIDLTKQFNALSTVLKSDAAALAVVVTSPDVLATPFEKYGANFAVFEGKWGFEKGNNNENENNCFITLTHTLSQAHSLSHKPSLSHAHTISHTYTGSLCLSLIFFICLSFFLSLTHTLSHSLSLPLSYSERRNYQKPRSF